MHPFLKAWRFFRPDLGRMLGVLGLLVAAAGLNALKPWPLALMVDAVIGTGSLPAWLVASMGPGRVSLLLPLGIFLVGLHVAHAGLSALQGDWSIRIGLRGLTRVRAALFGWLERMSVRLWHGSNRGDILYRATWNVFAFQTLFQQGVVGFLQSTMMLSWMSVVMWRLNPKLAWGALAVVPLLMFIMRTFGRRMHERSTQAHRADSAIATVLDQTLAALPQMQSDGQEERERAKFQKAIVAGEKARARQHRGEVFYRFAVQGGLGAGTALVAVLGAGEVMAQRLTVGEWLVFVAYLAQFFEPLTQLSHLGGTMADASAGVRRVFEVLESEPDVRDASDARSVVRSPSGSSDRALVVRGALDFESVSFAYQEGRPVLQEVAFSLAAGERVALIGPSGGGKTTFLQLIPRFYDPTQGVIRLDGEDLRRLKRADLRRQVAWVAQEPLLLVGTVAENIAYGRPDATLSEIEAAAEAAQAIDFVRRLPQGFATELGEGGARLSVGEKQRISLARAFLKNAPIVLLDEPTSALDVESERLVVQSMGRLLQGRTSIVVAHRLSTIREVDRVIVLDGGRMDEMGSPDNLLGRPGYYQRLMHGPV